MGKREFVATTAIGKPGNPDWKAGDLVELEDEVQIERLLRIGAIIEPPPSKEDQDLGGAGGSGGPQVLLGSSYHESTYEIGGETVPLGDIVGAAFDASGLTLEQWNTLESADRDARIEKALQEMQVPANSDDDDDLAMKTKTELETLAKEKGVEGISKMTKADLIDALQAPASSDDDGA